MNEESSLAKNRAAEAISEARPTGSWARLGGGIGPGRRLPSHGA